MPSAPASGGSGTITIEGARECAWTLSSDATWITTEGEGRGQGAATVTYHVAANGTPVTRRARISIASTQLDIAQAGAACRFNLDTNQIEISAAGGNATIRTTAMDGCTWTAQSQDSWITVTAGPTGNGNGEVSLTVPPHAGAARQGTVVIAGHAVAVRQQGVGSSPTPPSPAPPPPTPPPPTPPSPPPSSPPPPTPPAPSPPSPSPAPTPIEPIDLEGRLTDLKGSCPAITFVLEGYTVYADQATDYRRGNCSHLHDRGRVEVRGQRYSDGRVRAERITVEDRKD